MKDVTAPIKNQHSTLKFYHFNEDFVQNEAFPNCHYFFMAPADLNNPIKNLKRFLVACPLGTHSTFQECFSLLPLARRREGGSLNSVPIFNLSLFCYLPRYIFFQRRIKNKALLTRELP